VFDIHRRHMGTAIKHPDIRALWRSGLSVRVPGCQNYNWQLNRVWRRMLHYFKSLKFYTFIYQLYAYANGGHQRV